MSGSAADKDNPTFANDTDTQQTPSIETSPGILPQKPIPDRAPSRKQAADQADPPDQKQQN